MVKDLTRAIVTRRREGAFRSEISQSCFQRVIGTLLSPALPPHVHMFGVDGRQNSTQGRPPLGAQ